MPHAERQDDDRRPCEAPETWQGVVPAVLADRRADQALAALIPGLSRAQAQRLLREGRCRVDGRVPAAAERLPAGSRVTATLAPPTTTVLPEGLALDILHEDADMIAVNKPAGMVVHPARGAPAGTLLNALMGRLGPGERATLVHRLDRDTSGVILAARTVEAHRALKAQLDAGLLKRSYQALVWGEPTPPEGTISAPLGRDRGVKTRMAVRADGTPAVTHYRVLRTVIHGGETVGVVEASLETGRTHQVRAHFEWLGHPLLGDRVYRGERGALTAAEQRLPGQALHSWRVEFTHPRSGEAMVIEAPPPPALGDLL